jgi:hypothetical protein
MCDRDGLLRIILFRKDVVVVHSSLEGKVFHSVCEAQTDLRHPQSPVDFLEKDLFLNVVESFGSFEGARKHRHMEPSEFLFSRNYRLGRMLWGSASLLKEKCFCILWEVETNHCH